MSAILEAASQLFDRGGATTTTIAQRAGVSIGSLYEYFRDKDAILDSLVDRHVREAEAQLHAALDGIEAVPGTLAAAIEALVTAIVAMHGDRPGLHRRIVAFGVGRSSIRRRIDEAERRFAERLGTLLRRHPDVHVPDPLLAARLVATSTNALVHRHVERPDDRDDVLVAELTRLWTGYLRGPSPGR